MFFLIPLSTWAAELCWSITDAFADHSSKKNSWVTDAAVETAEDHTCVVWEGSGVDVKKLQHPLLS